MAGESDVILSASAVKDYLSYNLESLLIIVLIAL